LTIGGQADVISTGGTLRLRSGPGLTFGIMSDMAAGTRVTILEGPRSADSLNWWRMRLTDGTEGWAADNIGGQPTLAPASTSPPPATTSLAAPTLLSPANGVLLTNFPRTTTLQWSSVSGAASYTVEVQYCESPSSCTTYITSGGMGGTNYAFDFIGDQPGRWRVKAVGLSGTESPFSEWWMFSYNTAGTGLPAPGLISPSNGAVFNNFPRTTELRWTSVSGASHYIVEIQYCQTGFVDCVSYPLVSGNVSTAYTFEFIGAQPGRWRVKSVTSGGVEGAWSEWWTFTYNV
jgi:hypothetical protein